MDRRLDQARLSEMTRVEQRLDRLVLRFETALQTTPHVSCELSAAWTSDAASAGSTQSGFSTSTCRPASIAASATS